VLYLYTFLYALILLFYFPFFWVRFRWLRRERLEMRPRLGLSLPPPSDYRPCLWLHAVSVGEILSLQRLVLQLRQRHPSWRFIVTSLTPAGLRLGRQRMASIAEIAPIPLDLPFSLRRFFRQVQPSLIVLTESEFWPNLLHWAKRSSLPVVLVNGRMSDRSLKRIRKFRRLFLAIVKNIDLFLVQSERDRQRFIDAGLPAHRVINTGNIKSDVEFKVLSEEERVSWRERLKLKPQDKIITAGSTHPKEEDLLLEALASLKEAKPELKLIIAPRHPERWPEISHLAESFFLPWERWSELRRKSEDKQATSPEWRVLIVDTLGELPVFYNLADMTFVGGSLVPRGGHNLLEPAFFGQPILFGPHMENFAQLAQEFLQKKAALEVRTKEDLKQAFLNIETTEMKMMGERAKVILAGLEGATKKTTAVLEEFMRQIEGKFYRSNAQEAGKSG